MGVRNPISARQTRQAASAAVQAAGRFGLVLERVEQQARESAAFLAVFTELSFLGRLYFLLRGKFRSADLDKYTALVMRGGR